MKRFAVAVMLLSVRGASAKLTLSIVIHAHSEYEAVGLCVDRCKEDEPGYIIGDVIALEIPPRR